MFYLDQHFDKTISSVYGSCEKGKTTPTIEIRTYTGKIR